MMCRDDVPSPADMDLSGNERTLFAPAKIMQIILKLGFQRELAPFGRGFGGQSPPDISVLISNEKLHIAGEHTGSPPAKRGDNKMSDMRLTKDKMNTFGGGEKGAFKTASRLEDFGERQNNANMVLAMNVNDLIKRVCFLEDQQVHFTDTLQRLAEKERKTVKSRRLKMKKKFNAIANELKSFKAELDRVRLSTKLNNSAIERLNTAIAIAEENSEKEE